MDWVFDMAHQWRYDFDAWPHPYNGMGAPGAMPTTLFVADIRGFDRLLAEHGQEYACGLIERYTSATLELVECLGGELVHIWADDLYVRFRTPAQAVRAAVELQARYEEVALPGGRGLGVGIGIAAGEMPWVGTGYVGAPVARAARLCALAGPFETLVDAHVRQEIREMCGVQFLPRRSQHLPHDCGTAEHPAIYSVVASHRESENLPHDRGTTQISAMSSVAGWQRAEHRLNPAMVLASIQRLDRLRGRVERNPAHALQLERSIMTLHRLLATLTRLKDTNGTTHTWFARENPNWIDQPELLSTGRSSTRSKRSSAGRIYPEPLRDDDAGVQ